MRTASRSRQYSARVLIHRAEPRSAGARSPAGTRSVEETTMPQTQASSTSVAPTIIGVLVLLLACAIALIVGLEARPSGGLAVPKGSHVVHVDERDFAIHVSEVTL